MARLGVSFDNGNDVVVLHVNEIENGHTNRFTISIRYSMNTPTTEMVRAAAMMNELLRMAQAELDFIVTAKGINNANR